MYLDPWIILFLGLAVVLAVWALVLVCGRLRE